MKKPNYCEAVYKGIYIAVESDNTASVSSCCVNKLGPKTSVINFHKNPYLVEQRRAFDQGLEPETCDRCWSSERRGLPSRRLDHIRDKPDLDPYELELIEMHYNVAPICNAKCITCGPHFSSLWAEENHRFGDDSGITRLFKEIRHSKPQFDLDLTRLRQVYFNGGEPFLSTDVNDRLRDIKAQQGTLADLGLVINTNASIFPRAEDVSLWNECRSITLICSIEALGDQFEYTRYPLKWSEVDHNIRNFHRLFDSKLTVNIGPNLGIHNALYYQDLVQWYRDLDHDKTTYRLSASSTAGWFGFDNVSEEVKKQLLDQIPEELSDLRNFILTSKHGDDQLWLSRFKTLDQRRNLDWSQSFPRLARAITLARSAKRSKQNFR